MSSPGGSTKKSSDGDDAGMIAGIIIACLVALCLCGAAVAYFAKQQGGPKLASRREAPLKTELGAYSTYSDDAKGPVKNPIVDESEEAELEDVHLAPGGSHEY